MFEEIVIENSRTLSKDLFFFLIKKEKCELRKIWNEKREK